ncbi:hypothetical protein PAL_GLEAN10005870 [Pteropus alecto]|uniref:Uncharacterized protein n=1 Tax=Pteropus alecto TaxID=9402 RepID=L5KYB7_PTEAL|nr:hypothetical protein PAL_GLEAN10005870 [Pteropus alecto]
MRHIGPVPTALPALRAEGPRASAAGEFGPGGEAGATAEEERRWRAAAAGLEPEEAGNLPGLRRVLSPVVELLPWACDHPAGLTHNAPGERVAAQPSGSAGEKRVSAGFCQGPSVQAWALQEPAGLARLTSATTSGYLALYVAVSKQIIIECTIELSTCHEALKWEQVALKELE